MARFVFSFSFLKTIFPKNGKRKSSSTELVEVAIPPDGPTADALAGCSHLIMSVGYESSPLPPLTVDGRPLATELWQTEALQPRETLRVPVGQPALQLQLPAGKGDTPPLLFGSGIAFPESLDHHPKWTKGGVEGFVGEGPVGISPMLARAKNIARMVAEAFNE